MEKSDNEIIARFMGLEWNSYERLKRNYDQNWSELMPVVEKISQHIYESYTENNGYKDITNHDRANLRTFGMIDNEGRWMVRINRMPLEQEDSLIKATYQAVVEFIKWYNSQSEKP